MELAIWVLVGVVAWIGWAIWAEQKDTLKEVRRVRELMEQSLEADERAVNRQQRYFDEISAILEKK